MLWCGAARVLVRPRSIFARSLSSSASYVELPQAWAATYEASSQEELLVAYRSWAPTYDTDSIGLFGYRAPARTAEVLSEKLEKARKEKPKEKPKQTLQVVGDPLCGHGGNSLAPFSRNEGSIRL